MIYLANTLILFTNILVSFAVHLMDRRRLMFINVNALGYTVVRNHCIDIPL